MLVAFSEKEFDLEYFMFYEKANTCNPILFLPFI